MTEEEITQLVKQVGFHGMLSIGVVMDAKQLKDFADLVANDMYQLARKHGAGFEREECAKIADEWVLAYPHPSKTIAETIRARGQE